MRLHTHRPIISHKMDGHDEVVDILGEPRWYIGPFRIPYWLWLMFYKRRARKVVNR